MGNCLVTKLNGVCNNPQLKKLGELLISIKKVDNPTRGSQGFSVKLSKDTDLTIIGDGYFTDYTLLPNNGNTLHANANVLTNFWVKCNSECSISIKNKYNLMELNLRDSGAGIDVNNNKSFDIGELSYSTELTKLDITSTSVYGDISALKNCTKLVQFLASESNVNGDIKALAACKSLTNLYLGNTNVDGDISYLAALVNLIDLHLYKTKVHGNISVIANLKKLPSVNMFDTAVSGDISTLASATQLTGLVFQNTNVSGDVSALRNLTKLSTLYLKSTGVITGDLAVMPAKFELISVNPNATFTWSDRPASSYIIGIDANPKFENVDSLLIGEAKCTKPAKVKYASILVSGARTSASDAAVQTLQSKGYTVSVTPA